MTTRRQALIGATAALLAAGAARAKPNIIRGLPKRPEIQPADTAVTAFAGRARLGPANTPSLLYSFGDYVRLFGGLDPRFPLGQAVYDFFQNGGSQAVLLRLKGSEVQGTAKLVIGGLRLKACAPGAWGNDITATVVARADGSFALIVTEGSHTETYGRVTFGGAFAIDTVLEQNSTLVRWSGDPGKPGDAITAATTQTFSGGTGGTALTPADYVAGMEALTASDFNLLCVPADQPGGDTDPAVYQAAHALCIQRRALLIADAPAAWLTAGDAQTGIAATGLAGASNAALYFPRIVVADAYGGANLTVSACGAIAGVYARTDSQRGVWAAPAGLNAGLTGALDVSAPLTDAQASALNALNINSLRRFNGAAPVVWGARTLSTFEEMRYVSVLRTGQFIENSVRQGTQWAQTPGPFRVIYRGQLSAQVSAFMMRLFKQGAFQGATPDQAFVVRCDGSTTTDADAAAGRVNILIGFAPLKPAEFVFMRIVLQRQV